MTFPNFTSQFNEISLNISYSSYLNYRCLTRLTRQILPVVKNGTQANIVDASLKKSHLWQHVHQQVVHLQRNLRAHLTDYCRHPASQTGPQTWLPYHRSQIPAPTKHHQRSPCRVTACQTTVIEVIILHGPATGEHAFIPCSYLIYTRPTIPIQTPAVSNTPLLCNDN